MNIQESSKHPETNDTSTPSSSGPSNFSAPQPTPNIIPTNPPPIYINSSNEGTTDQPSNLSHTNSPTEEDHINDDNSHIHPDEFEQFIRLGDGQRNPDTEGTTQPIETSSSSRIIHSIISGFQTVGEGVANGGTQVISTGMGVVSDVGNKGTDAFSKLFSVGRENSNAGSQASSSSAVPQRPMSREYPKSTVQLPVLYLRANVTPVMVIPRTDGSVLVVTRECLLIFFASGNKRVKKIAFTELDSNPDPQPPTTENNSTENHSQEPDRKIVLNIAVADRWYDTEELIAGCGNGLVRIVSLADGDEEKPPCGKVLRSSSFLGSIPTMLRCGQKHLGQVFVGMRDGPVHILDYSRMRIIRTISPPDICRMAVGAASSFASVTALACTCTEADNSNVVNEVHELAIGYEDGVVGVCSTGGTGLGKPFITHGRNVSGMVEFFDGIILVSIGDRSDPSLCVYESHSGRCLIRQMLPFGPCWISRVRPLLNLGGKSELVCPSENAFLIGGKNGEVWIYRLVVVSSVRMELRVMHKIDEIARKKMRKVVHVEFEPWLGVLVALLANGEIRTWKLCKTDVLQLTLTEDELCKRVKYTPENVKESLEKNHMIPETTRLNEMESWMKLQNILAEILDDDEIGDDKKDLIVGKFREKEQNICSEIGAADTDLRRVRRKIWGTYQVGLEERNDHIDRTEMCLWNATRRCAAAEVESVMRRYKERIERIESEAVTELKVCLQGFFGSFRDVTDTVSEKLERMNRDTIAIRTSFQ